MCRFGQKQFAQADPPRHQPLCHAQHRREVLLQNEKHAQTLNTVREIRTKLPRNAPYLRYQMLDQLSPHPKCLAQIYEAHLCIKFLSIPYNLPS